MRDHLKVLGWLYVVTGAFTLLLAIVFGVFFGFGAFFAARGEDAAVLGGIGVVLLLFISLMSLPAIILGWGLLTWKPWSRVLGIVLSVLHLASFPVGTMIGGYGLWVLLNDESKRLLEAGDPRLRVRAGW
ncbi:MAG TPA: hypothetical protein VF092_22550 [Longimicrobium sp.]